MTNAQKYLKDGVSVEEFNKELFKNCATTGMFNYLNTNAIIEWLNEQAKPTLTEDERVILRCMCENYVCIGRLDEELYIAYKMNEKRWYQFNFDMYNDLFKFIKERRRIRNSRTIERRLEMGQEISEEEMQKLSAHPEDGVWALCDCINYLYNEIKKLKVRMEKNTR